MGLFNRNEEKKLASQERREDRRNKRNKIGTAFTVNDAIVANKIDNIIANNSDSLSVTENYQIGGITSKVVSDATNPTTFFIPVYSSEINYTDTTNTAIKNDTINKQDYKSKIFHIPISNDSLAHDWMSTKIIEHEGGFSDIKNDSGGKTNKGISSAVWNNFAKPTLGIEPTEQNLRSITDKDAKKIYKINYYDRAQIDKINNYDLQYAFYDFFVNAESGAVKTMQQLLCDKFDKNIAVDGIIGTATVNAINSIKNQDELYDSFIDARSEFYNKIVNKNPSKSNFLEGWQNRVNKFRRN